MELNKTIQVVAIWAAVGYSAPHLGFFTAFLAIVALVTTEVVVSA